MSLISQRPRDCLPCKFISGFGLIGMGLYVVYQSRKFHGFEKKIITGVSACIIFLGTARLLDLPPFPLENSSRNEE